MNRKAAHRHLRTSFTIRNNPRVELHLFRIVAQKHGQQKSGREAASLHWAVWLNQ
jgi:hypothetical protein